MSFQALDVALELVSSLRQPVGVLATRDPSLADQVRRAASSVALNLGEGRRRVGRDRVQHFRIAAGSAEEARTALRVALAWGHLGSAQVGDALALCDRVLAMLWRLTR